jgi:hypothetical protein
VDEVPVAASRKPVDHPVAGGRFDGCGAAVGGEAIAGREAADRGDATDDRGRDDRADAVDHSCSSRIQRCPAGVGVKDRNIAATWATR